MITLRGLKALVASIAVLLVAATASAETARISISTGGTGGIYYPLGDGMAKVLSKYVAGLQATAEATGGSVDNLKLIGVGKTQVGFSMVDAAWDAANGTDQFKDGKINVRTLMVLYPNRLQIVTVDGTGISKLSDFKGRRISTGSPGSGVEVVALRVLEAMGLDAKKDIKQERLGASESANAIKDRKIDAFFWVGGLPTAAVTDLGATPGVKIKLVDHSDVVDKMNAKYGKLYVTDVIPAKTYPGQDEDNKIATVWNILVTDEKMPDAVAYAIVQIVVEHKPELVAVHKEAENIDLKYQVKESSPVPWHPGALKYFTEKGLKM